MDGQWNYARFVGTRGKSACGWGGRSPVLLPLARNKEVNIPKKYPRFAGDMDGHCWQLFDACIAGYSNAEVSSPQSDIFVRGSSLEKLVVIELRNEFGFRNGRSQD